MSQRLMIRLVVWTALLIVILILKFVPFGGGPTPDTTIIDTTAHLALRQATPEEWTTDLAELGRQKLGRRVVIVEMRDRIGQNADLVARGVLVHLQDAIGERFAYIAHPDELAGGRTAKQVLSGLKSAISFNRAFIVSATDPALGPWDLERLPVDLFLEPGWQVLTAPETLVPDEAAAPSPAAASTGPVVTPPVPEPEPAAGSEPEPAAIE